MYGQKVARFENNFVISKVRISFKKANIRQKYFWFTFKNKNPLSMNPYSKILRWIFFLPLLYLALMIFRLLLVISQFWVKDQVHEDSGWAYFVATTTFSMIWLPYMIQYFLIMWIISMCPQPRVGSIIALVLLGLSSLYYYFMTDFTFIFAGFVCDMVTLGTLIHFVSNKRMFD